MLDEIVTSAAAASASAADGVSDPELADNELISLAPPLFQPQPDEGLEEYLHRVTFDTDDMSMIFRALHDQQQSWMPADQRELMSARFAKMDLTTRRDDENHLRAPLPGSLERPCVRGGNCEAMKIPGVENPVPLVQHHTLEQRAAHAENNVPLEESLCIMCKRHTVGSFYINSMAEAPLPDEPGAGNEMRVFHSHGNYVDIPGEYILEQCVAIGDTHTHGVLTPCAMHVAAWYRAERGADGVLRFHQDGYLTPRGSDF